MFAFNSIEGAPVQRQVLILPIPRRRRRPRRRASRSQTHPRRSARRPAEEGRSDCHSHSTGARCCPESDPAKTVSSNRLPLALPASRSARGVNTAYIVARVSLNRTHDRSPDDLEIIYEELVHIRALSHLSTTVKRELASIIVFESHPKADTIRE